jgi:hypothetical protein
MILFLEIFSTWIFIWFILYYLHITHINPLFYLIIALIYALFGIFLLIYYHQSLYGILLFISINIFIKVIPIYLLLTSNKKFIINYPNIGFGLYLFLIYLSLMILIIHKNPFDSYMDLLKLFK